METETTLTQRAITSAEHGVGDVAVAGLGERREGSVNMPRRFSPSQIRSKLRQAQSKMRQAQSRMRSAQSQLRSAESRARRHVAQLRTLEARLRRDQRRLEAELRQFARSGYRVVVIRREEWEELSYDEQERLEQAAYEEDIELELGDADDFEEG